MSYEDFIKGRGAQKNSSNKFDAHSHETRDDFLNYCNAEGEEAVNFKTTTIETFPKTIVNKVTSPDVGMDFSLNPYQGFTATPATVMNSGVIAPVWISNKKSW